MAGVLLHGLARLALTAFLYLRSPYSLDYGEGCVLAMVQLLDERGTYFVSLADYPFVQFNYPPVFPGVVWPFYHCLGPSLFVPRLISLMATAGTLAIMYRLTRRLAGSRAVAMGLTGIALCPWFVQTWAPLARVDMLAIFFSLAGLLAFSEGMPLWAAFGLFWLGVFTKQNALLAPAAVLLVLLLSTPWRRGAAAAAGFLVPLAILFTVLVVTTQGEAYRHLITYTMAAGFDSTRIGAAYHDLTRVAWPLFLVIGVGLVRRPRALAQGPGALPLLYGLLSLAGLVSVAKIGAVQNYFIEPWLATIVAASAALGPATERPAPALRLPALLLAAAVALYTNDWAHDPPHAIAHPDEDAAFRRLRAVVHETDGPILSENLAVLVLDRKPVLVEPFGFLILSRAHLLRTRPVVRDCEARLFRVVVLEGLLERVPSLRECLEARYRVVEDLPPYRLLRPDASRPLPSADRPATR